MQRQKELYCICRECKVNDMRDGTDTSSAVHVTLRRFGELCRVMRCGRSSFEVEIKNECRRSEEEVKSLKKIECRHP